MVGAPGDDDGGSRRGAVWILFLDAGKYRREAVLKKKIERAILYFQSPLLVACGLMHALRGCKCHVRCTECGRKWAEYFWGCRGLSLTTMIIFCVCDKSKSPLHRNYLRNMGTLGLRHFF